MQSCECGCGELVRHRFAVGHHRRGVRHAPEVKRRIAAKMSGERHPNWGKKFDDAYREKLSEAHRGRSAQSENPNWRGGRWVDKQSGYVYVTISDGDPFASMRRRGRTYVAEHRLVVAKALGSPLRPEQVVHHANGDRTDNRLENLRLFDSHADHMKFHKSLQSPEERHAVGVKAGKASGAKRRQRSSSVG